MQFEETIFEYRRRQVKRRERLVSPLGIQWRDDTSKNGFPRFSSRTRKARLYALKMKIFRLYRHEQPLRFQSSLRLKASSLSKRRYRGNAIILASTDHSWPISACHSRQRTTHSRWSTRCEITCHRVNVGSCTFNYALIFFHLYAVCAEYPARLERYASGCLSTWS